MAGRIKDPFSLVTASLYNAMVHLNRGEPELALQLLAAAEALAAEQRLGLVVVPEILRGVALTAQGALEEAVACLRRGLADGPNVTRVRTYGLAGLADALSRRREHEAALGAAKDGLQVQEETGHRQWHAELHRVEGIALLGLNKLEDAQSALEQALRVARRQQAKAYELRAGLRSRPAVGRTEPSSRGARSACAGLRLVHRRVRYARSQRSKGAARRTDVSRSASMTKSLTRMIASWATRPAAGGGMKVSTCVGRKLSCERPELAQTCRYSGDQRMRRIAPKPILLARPSEPLRLRARETPLRDGRSPLGQPYPLPASHGPSTSRV